MAPRLLIRRQTAARSRLGSDGTWYTSTSQRPGRGLAAGAETPAGPASPAPPEPGTAWPGGCGLPGLAGTLSAAHVHRVDAGGPDADDNPLLARLVHHAEVGLVLGAELAGELVVVVRRDLGVAAQLQVAVRSGRIEDEQRALLPPHQVLGLLPRGVEGEGNAVVVGEEPDLGELRPAVRADGGEGGAVRAEQVAEILRNRRRHASSIPCAGARARRNPATTAATARTLRTGTITAGATA